jgi:hypothetical protein
MVVKIISTRTPVLEYDLGHFSIDLSRKTAVLIRQSMKNAGKDHYESRLLQENLVPIAIKIRGDEDDRNTLLFDEGAGISGTKGYDERPKLSALYLAIANDIVGSLLVARPDRLFRDKHFTNVSMFTDLAERKRLILIVPGKRIYDFTKYDDLKAFQRDMQDAYNYLATHIKYMNDTRDQKVQRGLYGGGSLPAPYVIDRRVRKDEQVPIIYIPWLDPAIDLFKRFKAFDFSMGHICRYIESKIYIFPAPSFEDTKLYMFKSPMRFARGGYSFGDANTVRAYLSNLTLGGYARVGKDEEGNLLLLPNAFEAAIPFDLLDECYGAITGHHIDGTPFEGRTNTRRYMRGNPQGANALLHSIITSEQGHIQPHTSPVKGIYQYHCYKELEREGYIRKTRHLMEQVILWSLRCPELDAVVLDRLYELAEHDTQMAERVRATFESLKGQGIDETNLLCQQIEQTQKRIQRLDFLLTDTNIPLDVETAKKYAEDLAELRPKLARLLKKQKASPDLDPEKTITNFYFILSRVTTEFEKQGIDVQKQMMSKLVNQVTVNKLAPHLYSLFIIWQEGIAVRPDVALLWRGSAKREAQGWSAEEDELIRTYWPETHPLEIMHMMPERSNINIASRALQLGVKRTLRTGRTKLNVYERTVTYADLQAAMEYAGEQDISYICELINEMAAKTTHANITAYWPLPVEVVGFCTVIDDETGQSSVASNLSPAAISSS